MEVNLFFFFLLQQQCLFDTPEEVLTIGYENALLYITHSIDKLMNDEVPITDLVISKLLRQNIEKYRSLFPHVAAAIRLNVSGVITNRGNSEVRFIFVESSDFICLFYAFFVNICDCIYFEWLYQHYCRN